MSEFKPQHDPLLWKMLEGLLISVLIVAAFVVGLAGIIWDAVKYWWEGK